MPMQAQRGGGLAPTQSQPRRWKGVGGQHHAPAVYPWETPGTNCTEGWVGLRTGLDGHGKSRSHRDSILGTPSP